MDSIDERGVENRARLKFKRERVDRTFASVVVIEELPRA